jgi:predicted urease superfamily metal-dependent hydrolase
MEQYMIICKDGSRYVLAELTNGKVTAFCDHKDYNHLVALHAHWVACAKKAHRKRPAPLKGYYPVEFDDLLKYGDAILKTRPQEGLSPTD